MLLLAALDAGAATAFLGQLSGAVLKSALGWAFGGGEDDVPSSRAS